MGRPLVERVTVDCVGCGTAIVKRKSDADRSKTGRFFCSMDCVRTSGVGRRPTTIPRRQCEVCGDPFVAYGKQVGRFCSRNCHNTWQGRNRRQCVCEWCGGQFSVSPSAQGRDAVRFCSKPCEGASRRKRPLDRMHNGKPALLDSNGYVKIWEPDHPSRTYGGWLPEHRTVMENFLGRRLRPDEHVHHVNGRKDDNRLENLLVLGHSEHSTLTGKERAEALAAMQAELAEYRRRFGPL